VTETCASTCAACGSVTKDWCPGAEAALMPPSVNPATTTALARIGDDEAGVASGIVNTFHELGGAIGVAAVSSIAAPSLVAAGVSPAGFTRAFTFNVIAALVAALLAAMVVPAGKAPAEAMPHAH